jgi:hypothetical protein
VCQGALDSLTQIDVAEHAEKLGGLAPRPQPECPIRKPKVEDNNNMRALPLRGSECSAPMKVAYYSLQRYAGFLALPFKTAQNPSAK